MLLDKRSTHALSLTQYYHSVAHNRFIITDEATLPCRPILELFKVKLFKRMLCCKYVCWPISLSWIKSRLWHCGHVTFIENTLFSLWSPLEIIRHYWTTCVLPTCVFTLQTSHWPIYSKRGVILTPGGQVTPLHLISSSCGFVLPVQWCTSRVTQCATLSGTAQYFNHQSHIFRQCPTICWL